MVAVAVIGVLASSVFLATNPAGQLAKSRDAQRKNDLERIKSALDIYYNDKNNYPAAGAGGTIAGVPWGNPWSPYMTKTPKDPLSGQDYRYESDGSSYRLYARLERCSDSQTTVGVDCLRPENYSINSSNLAMLTPIPTSAPTPTPIPPTSTPTLTPAPAPKRVFVSSSIYNGNLGGLSGADSKCQTLANTATLGGAWKAWLSDSSTSASSRLSHASVSYVLVDGTLVANNWTDLVTNKSGNYITNAIKKDQNGNPVSGQYAWTNTRPDGTIIYGAYPPYTCSDWTSSSGFYRGFLGELSYIDVNWTQVLRNGGVYGTYSWCTNPRYLYCFEQ